MTGAIYYGRVVHHRVRPRRHKLVYRVFSLLIDLDAIQDAARPSQLFSHNRWNLFSLHDRDHGPGDGTPLRAWIGGQLAAAGIDITGGRVDLLCYPRILGYVFNPLSVYFCHTADGAVAAVVYEVNNTFGDRHSYLIPVEAPVPAVIRQACDKQMYVSPFNDVSGGYRFRVVAPKADVEVVINYVDGDGMILHAAFRGERGPLTDRALATAFVRYPLMTLKVIAGIHWEALRLWRKGLKLFRRPAPPAEAVTVVTSPARPQLDHSRASPCPIPASPA